MEEWKRKNRGGGGIGKENRRMVHINYKLTGTITAISQVPLALVHGFL